MANDYESPTTEAKRQLAEQIVFAAQAAEQIEAQTKEILARHVDLLGPELVKMIAERERDRVLIEGRDLAIAGRFEEFNPQLVDTRLRTDEELEDHSFGP